MSEERLKEAGEIVEQLMPASLGYTMANTWATRYLEDVTSLRDRVAELEGALRQNIWLYEEVGLTSEQKAHEMYLNSVDVLAHSVKEGGREQRTGAEFNILDAAAGKPAWHDRAKEGGGE